MENKIKTFRERQSCLRNSWVTDVQEASRGKSLADAIRVLSAAQKKGVESEVSAQDIQELKEEIKM